MVDKIIKCPICNEFTTFTISKELIAGRTFPVPCLFIHQRTEDNHTFIAYLDSELSVCDIEKPVIITNK